MFHMGLYENRLLPEIQRFIIMFPVKLARTGKKTHHNCQVHTQSHSVGECCLFIPLIPIKSNHCYSKSHVSQNKPLLLYFVVPQPAVPAPPHHRPMGKTKTFYATWCSALVVNFGIYLHNTWHSWKKSWYIGKHSISPKDSIWWYRVSVDHRNIVSTVSSTGRIQVTEMGTNGVATSLCEVAPSTYKLVY